MVKQQVERLTSKKDVTAAPVVVHSDIILTSDRPTLNTQDSDAPPVKERIERLTSKKEIVLAPVHSDIDLTSDRPTLKLDKEANSFHKVSSALPSPGGSLAVDSPFKRKSSQYGSTVGTVKESTGEGKGDEDDDDDQDEIVVPFDEDKVTFASVSKCYLDHVGLTLLCFLVFVSYSLRNP